MHKIFKSIELILQWKQFICLFLVKELISFWFDWGTLSDLFDVKLWGLRPSVYLFYSFAFKVMNKSYLLWLKLVCTFLIWFHESKDSFVHLFSLLDKYRVYVYLWYLVRPLSSPDRLNESYLRFFLVCHLFCKLFSESWGVWGFLLGFLLKKLLLKIDV